MSRFKKSFLFLVLVGTAFALTQCKETKKEEKIEMTEASDPEVHIEKSIFGSLPDGTNVDKYTLSNSTGMVVDIITYGGIITSWKAADRQGNSQDIVLGFDSLDKYLESNPYFGALIGRYGNRIAKGKFNLDGTTYTLATNNGENHLHGGEVGFDKVVWKAKTQETDISVSLILEYLSKDGEEGYPGNLKTRVTYTLDTDNALKVDYEAETDKPTVVNLTQHTYFNLSGDFDQDILDHSVAINADAYLPVDEGLIPTGELRPVEGTPFDFRAPKQIGAEINASNEQLSLGGGYDHCWVLNDTDEPLHLAATAYHADSGRFLEIHTDEPAVQFYTGNFLDGTLTSKSGGTYGQRSGFCLETQHYPDSPNKEEFPSVRLNPGETYKTSTVFKLSVQ